MALCAGVWRANRCTEVRPGDSHAVIPAPVYPHVGLLGHMAVNTLAARRPRNVVVMGGCIK